MRALLWSVPALLLGAACALIYSRLSFMRTAVSNGIVDFAIALASMPLVLLVLVCGIQAIRNLVATLWPGLGVLSSAGTLELRLGPFGHRVYSADELNIRYPFELIDDPEGGGVEQYLPEEEQIERMLPRMQHRAVKEPINRTILRYVVGDEAEIAAKLRPAIERWRTIQGGRESSSSPCPLPEGEMSDGESSGAPI
jgi:hypothetical protein